DPAPVDGLNQAVGDQLVLARRINVPAPDPKVEPVEFGIGARSGRWFDRLGRTRGASDQEPGRNQNSAHVSSVFERSRRRPSNPAWIASHSLAMTIRRTNL